MLIPMADTAARHSILVGVDGSPSASQAVEWAAREGLRRTLPLRLFHAAVMPPSSAHVAAYPGTGLEESIIEQGHRWLDEAAALARRTADGAEVRTELRVGKPANELADESEHAFMAVLGSRGLGGFRGMLLGSVSQGVAARGRCPVIVVRGKLPGLPPQDAGPVVVGVDGSAVSEAAVAFAYEEASLRETSLVAVHTWLDASVAQTWMAMPFDIDWAAVAEDERRVLAERLAGWAEKYPDVPVRREVLYDRPVRALLAQAEDAQLLVVGSRGRGGFTGMTLGSTSQALLHYSECPVAVVR